MRLFVLIILISACTAKLLHLIQTPREKPVCYNNDTGPIWAIICKNTEHGEVPGSLNGYGEAYYPWGGHRHRCNDFKVISGKLVSSRVFSPSLCPNRPSAYQTNDHQYYFSAVAKSSFGWVVGKANSAGTSAWFYVYGEESKINSSDIEFFLVC